MPSGDSRIASAGELLGQRPEHRERDERPREHEDRDLHPPDELKDRLDGSVIQLSVPDDRQTATMEALRATNGDSPQLDKLQGRITIPAPFGVRSSI